jgi:diguanylate cyclase (GGDEF)-like protein
MAKVRQERRMTLEIVKLCLRLDKHAHQAYQELARTAPDSELSRFWHAMAVEEFEHLRFWKEVLQHPAGLETLPRVFERPGEIIDELRDTLARVELLLAKGCARLSVEEAFTLAYRLEFYMLHPAFEVLFNLLCFLVGSPCPGQEYEQHIKRFVQALSAYGHINPTLELLGETLSRLWQENRRLAEQATRDTLTGCLNRQAFMEIALHLCVLAQRQAETVGVMMIDLDHFKEVNDTWGHQVGDLVLKATGLIIRSNLRASDVVCRYGGEEFVVLMPDVRPNVAARVAERIREMFAEQSIENVRPTLSVGVALGRIEGDVEACLYELIRQADMKLYQAKQSGRNRVVC